MNERHDPHDDHRIDRATGDAPWETIPTMGALQRDDDERAAAALQSALTPGAALPPGMRERLIADGEALVAARDVMAPVGVRTKKSVWMPLALAASLLLAAGVGVVGYLQVQQRNEAIDQQEQRLAALNAQITENNTLLAQAEASVTELMGNIETLDATASQQAVALAEAARRETQIAEELIVATQRSAELRAELAAAGDEIALAQLEITRLGSTPNPEEMRRERVQLLDVPGTIRIAWSPFNLPEAPAAEQPDVTGDVVWNDDLETGYLRFVGLDPNDPNIEQYQVWVIDDRGLEQKVSGGVFDVTERGEVIVPIRPGIDVGRVQLFAITVENPGGTWVPDLSRRIVAAPRGEG